jgi:hypothetical protein
MIKTNEIFNIGGTGNGTEEVKTGVFAFLSAPANTTVTTGGTYYPIAGTFTNDPLENFGAGTVYTPSIKYEGNLNTSFEIDYNATFRTTSSNETVSFGIKKNGVLLAGSVMGNVAKTAATDYAVSGTVVTTLTKDDEIQLVITAETDGEVVSVQNFTTTIRPFFM